MVVTNNNSKMTYTSSERDNIIRNIANQMGQQGGQTTYTAAPKPEPKTYRTYSPEAQALNMDQSTYENIISMGADPKQYYMDYNNRTMTEGQDYGTPGTSSYTGPALLKYGQVIGGPGGMMGLGRSTQNTSPPTQAQIDAMMQQMQNNPQGFQDFDEVVKYYGSNDPYMSQQQEIRDMVGGVDTGYMSGADYYDQYVLGLDGQGIAEKYGIPYASGGRVGLANGSDDMVLPMKKPQVERFLTREEAEARDPQMFVDTTTSAYGAAVPEGTPTLEKVFELEVAEIAKVILGTKSSPRGEGEIQDTETMSSKDFMKNAYLIPKVKELSENYGYSEAEILKMIKDEMMTYSKPKKEMMNKGGLMRLNYMIGGEAKQMEAGAPPIMYSGNMDPNAPNQQVGLPAVPGLMQMAEDGPEFDMRENGGFQPLGRQEGKDDVPAMLAKNEFVMTADAVRAAGGGSIQKGAQKMYDTMKKLESRVS